MTDNSVSNDINIIDRHEVVGSRMAMTAIYRDVSRDGTVLPEFFSVRFSTKYFDTNGIQNFHPALGERLINEAFEELDVHARNFNNAAHVPNDRLPSRDRESFQFVAIFTDRRAKAIWQRDDENKHYYEKGGL